MCQDCHLRFELRIGQAMRSALEILRLRVKRSLSLSKGCIASVSVMLFFVNNFVRLKCASSFYHIYFLLFSFQGGKIGGITYFLVVGRYNSMKADYQKMDSELSKLK